MVLVNGMVRVPQLSGVLGERAATLNDPAQRWTGPAER